MAKGFNLTAEINLRGPANIRTIVADIRRQLGTVTANVDVRINPSTSRNITTLTQNLSRLNNVLGQTTTLSNQASVSLNNLARAGASVTANIGNIARTTQNAAASVGQISNNANQAGQALNVARSEFEEFGRQSALAVRRFAALATVTSIIYKISNAINSASAEYLAFNKEIVRVAQVTDSSVASLGSLEKRITTLATSFGVASRDLIQISSTLAQAGLTAKDTEQALRALALSALAPSFDSLNETVEGSIALMRQFGIGASDLEAALGSINAVSAKFAVESSDIITAIQRTGGVFAAASRGVSSGKDALNEFIAVFTSVRATTRESAETIATGLRTIFTRIQRGGTIDALKEYGVTLTDLQGKFVGPYEAVRRLAFGLNQLDPRDLRFGRIVEELGGFRQIGKVIPLIQQFTTAQQALAVAQRGQGSLATDAATAQQALAIRIAKVREEFIALIRSVGQSDSFQNFVSLSLDLASGLIRVADAAKDVLPALTAIAAIRGASFLTQFGAGFIGGLRKRSNNGGPVARFATGGLVPGQGNSDTFPAMLTPGEFVIRKKAVERIGVSGLSRLNKHGDGGVIRDVSTGSSAKRKKYAVGGIASVNNLNEVYDGDTLKINVTPTTDPFNTRTRLLGVDAFEVTNQSGRKNSWQKALGLKAKQVAARHYENKNNKEILASLRPEKGQDKYGRILLEDNELATNLISQGLAVSYGSGAASSMTKEQYKQKFGRSVDDTLRSIPSMKPEKIQNKNFGGIIQRFMAGGAAKETRQFGSGAFPFPKRISNSYFREIDDRALKEKAEKLGLYGSFSEFPEEKRVIVNAQDISDTFESTGFDLNAFKESFKRRTSTLSVFKSMSDFAKFIGLPKEDLSLVLPAHIDFSNMGGLGPRGQFDRTGTGKRGAEAYDLSSFGFGSAQEQDLYGYEKLVAEKQKELKKIHKTPVRTFDDGSFSTDTDASKKTWDEINDLQIRIMDLKSIKMKAEASVRDQIQATAAQTGRGSVSLNTKGLTTQKNDTFFHELTHQLFQGLRTRSVETFDKYKARVVSLFDGDNNDLADAFDALENSYNSADVVYGRSYKIGTLDQIIQQNRSSGRGTKPAQTPEAAADATKFWSQSLGIKRAQDFRPINQDVNKTLLNNSISQSYIDRIEDSGKEEFLTTLIQNSNRMSPLLQEALDSSLNELFGSAGITRQKYAEGGLVERKIGIVDTDVLRNPINANIVRPAMEKMGLTDVSKYSIELGRLAAQARKGGSLNKIRAIAGAAGSGKSSLATGRGANDNARLRRTIRSQILTPEDIAKVNEVIVLTSTASDAKLEAYLKDVDRAYVLSSSTQSEREQLISNRESRDLTGEGLYGRRPGTTTAASTDFTVEETILRDTLGKKATVLGRKAGSFALRRKTESELPEIVQAGGFYTGGFAPPTAGHRGAFDTLLENMLKSDPSSSMEDILVSIAPNLPMVAGKEGIQHAARYGIFPADFRTLLARINFPGAMLTTQESAPGTYPKFMEVKSEGERRKFARVSGAMAITSGKEEGVLGRYQRSGMNVTDIPRIDDISATKVREALFNGDDSALLSYLNPEIASILMGNRPQLRNRSVMVPALLEEVQKYVDIKKTESNSQVKQLLETAPGGPYGNVSEKLRKNAPEIAAQIEGIRDQRDRVSRGAFGYRSHNVIAALSAKYPEMYGLDIARRSMRSMPAADVNKEIMAAQIKEQMGGEFEGVDIAQASALQGSILAKVMKETSGPKGSGELPTTTKEILAKLGDRVLPSDPKFGEFAGKRIRDTAKNNRLGYWATNYAPTLLEKPEKLASYVAARDYVKSLYSGASTEATAKALTETKEKIEQSTMLGLIGLYGKNGITGPVVWNLGKNAQGEDIDLNATIMERVLPIKYKDVADYINRETGNIVTTAAQMLGTKDPKKLSAKQRDVLNQGNIEGGILEQLIAMLGGDVLDDAVRTRAVDFPQGIGTAAAKIFGINPNIPTEAKRTIDSGSRSKAIEEFQRYFRSIYGIPEPQEQTKEKVQAFALGGNVRRFAIGGGVSSEDTVPALLTPGEFVINKKAASRIGTAKLHRLNKADRISGFNKGGSVGVQTFAVGGGVGGGFGDDALNSQAIQIAKDLMKTAGLGAKAALDQARQQVRDSIAGPSLPPKGPTSMVPQQFTTSSGTRLTYGQKAATAIPVSTADIQQQRLERRAASRGNVVGGFEFEVDEKGRRRVKGNRRMAGQGADITATGGQGGSWQINPVVSGGAQYVSSGRSQGSTRSGGTFASQQAAIKASGSSSSVMSQQYLNQALKNITTSAQQSAGFFKQIQTAASSVATKTGGMFNNIKNYAMGTHTLRGKQLTDDDIRRKQDRAGRAQQMGMGLAFTAPMIGEMAGSAIGGTTGSGVSSVATGLGATMGVGMQFAGIPFVGTIAMFTSVLAAGVSVVENYNKGVAEAEKQLSEKRIQSETENVDRSLKSLEKDPRNVAASKAVATSIEKIASEENLVMQQNKVLNEPGMIAKAINYASFGMIGTGAKTTEEIAQQNTAANKAASDVAMQALTSKISGGMTMEEALKSFGNPDIVKQQIAEGVGGEFSIRNARLQQTREKFVGKTDAGSKEILANLDAAIKENNEAAFKSATELLRASEADIQRAKASQAVAKALNQASVSIDRTFSNMESALAKGADVLSKTSESLSALASGSVSTRGVFAQQNVLENPGAYTARERQQAVGSASAIFGQDAGFVQRLTDVGGRVKDTIASLSVNAQQTGESKELAAENIQRAVDKQLRDAFGDNNLSRQISEQLKVALQGQVTDEKTKEIDLDKLLSETTGLTSLLEAEKKAFKALSDAAKLATDSISLYSEQLDKAIAMMNESRAIKGESVSARASNEFRMIEAFGGKVNLQDRLTARRQESAARLGIKPEDANLSSLKQRLNALTQQRSQIEAQKNQYQANSAITDPRTIQGVNNFNKALANLNNEIQSTKDAIKGLPKDIQGMLDDTFGELQKKIGDFEARQQAGAGFAEKMVTSTPTELSDLNNTYGLLTNALNGQVRTIQQSVAAQQAYNQTLNNGGTMTEAMTAAQTAFAAENRNVFSMFSEMINIAGIEKPEANRMRADLLENMARSQGLNVQNSPVFAQLIASLRKAPEEDPEIKRLKDLYSQLSAAQQEAFQQSSDMIMKDASNLITQAAQQIKLAIETSRISFNMQQLEGIGLGISRPGQVMTRSEGGIVYASEGKFIPRGTDTVPAMLSPGEFVVNAQSTRANLPVLDAINKSRGGSVGYFMAGTAVPVRRRSSRSAKPVQQVPNPSTVRTSLIRQGMDPFKAYELSDSQLLKLQEDFLSIPSKAERGTALQRWIRQYGRGPILTQDQIIGNWLNSSSSGASPMDPSLRSTMRSSMGPFNAFGDGPKPSWMNSRSILPTNASGFRRFGENFKFLRSDMGELYSYGKRTIGSVGKAMSKYGSGVMSRVDDVIPGLGKIPFGIGTLLRGVGATTTVGKDVASPITKLLRNTFNMASGQPFGAGYPRPSGIESGLGNLGLGLLSNVAIGNILPRLGFSDTTTQNTQGVANLGLGTATAMRAGASLTGAAAPAIAVNTGVSLADELIRYGYSAATGTTDEYWKYRENQDAGVHNALESGITAGLNPGRLFSRYLGFHAHSPLFQTGITRDDGSYSWWGLRSGGRKSEKFDAPGSSGAKPVNKPMGPRGTSLDNAIAQARIDMATSENRNRPKSFGMAARTFRYGVPVTGTPDTTQDGMRTVRLTRTEEDWIMRQGNLLDRRDQALKITDKKQREQQLAIIDRDIRNHEDARTAMTESGQENWWGGVSPVTVQNLPNIGSRDRVEDRNIASQYVSEYRETSRRDRIRAQQAEAERAANAKSEADRKKQEEDDTKFRNFTQGVSNFASNLYSGAVNIYNQTMDQERKKQEQISRSNRHKQVDSILQRPALPSMLGDESLNQRKAARDQARAELDAISPPTHPFDVTFGQRGGGVGGDEARVDDGVRINNDGKVVGTGKMLTRKEYEEAHKDEMIAYENARGEYATKKKAAQDKLDRENQSIVSWNEKTAAGVSSEERTKQWASYDKARSDEKEKMRQKAAREEKLAEKRAQNQALKEQAGMYAATAQVLQMPVPNNPNAIANFRDRVVNRLKSSFGTYGASDPKTLRAYGLNENAIKFLFNPFTEDQNKALAEIISKKLYEGGATRPSLRRDYALLKAGYEGPNGLLDYARKTGRFDILDRKQFLEKLKYKEYGQIMTQSRRFDELAYNAAISNSPSKQAGARTNMSRRLTQLGYINPRGKPEDNARRLNALGFNPDTVAFMYPGQAGGMLAGRMGPVGRSNGGIVYASEGTFVNFEPRGTDTVPAMLTPGEFVVNARSTAQHLPLLKAINQSKGGKVSYLQDGGWAHHEAKAMRGIQAEQLRQANKESGNFTPQTRRYAKDIILNRNNYDIFNDDFIDDALQADPIIEEYRGQLAVAQDRNALAAQLYGKHHFRRQLLINIKNAADIQRKASINQDLSRVIYGKTLDEILNTQSGNAELEIEAQNKILEILRPLSDNYTPPPPQAPPTRRIGAGYLDKGGVVYAQFGIKTPPLTQRTIDRMSGPKVVRRTPKPISSPWYDKTLGMGSTLLEDLFKKDSKGNDIGVDYVYKNIMKHRMNHARPFDKLPMMHSEDETYARKNETSILDEVQGVGRGRPLRSGEYNPWNPEDRKKATNRINTKRSFAGVTVLGGPDINKPRLNGDALTARSPNLDETLSGFYPDSEGISLRQRLEKIKEQSAKSKEKPKQDLPRWLIEANAAMKKGEEANKRVSVQATKPISWGKFGFGNTDKNPINKENGGVVYAQDGTYIPFKTPRDKALNDRKLEIERRQEEIKKAALLDKLRKQLDAQLIPADKQAQAQRNSRMRRYDHDDEMQRRRDNIIDPEQVKFATDMIRENKRFEAEQTRENARIDAETARNQRANSTNIPPMPAHLQPKKKMSGGMVYADSGLLVPYQPIGTDTVPAMLTPGEFVINRESTAKHLPLLKSINSGSFNHGGIVNYLQDGGKVNKVKQAFEEEMARKRLRYQQEKDIRSMSAAKYRSDRGQSIPKDLQKRVANVQNRDPLTYNIMKGGLSPSQQVQTSSDKLNTNFSQINQQSQLINRSFIQLGGSVIALTQVLGKLNGEISLMGGGAGVSNTSGQAQLGLDGLGQFVSRFDTFIESLSKLNLPPIISLQVAPITLNITGGEALRVALEGPMREQIRSEITAAFNRLNNATEGAIQV